MSQPYLWKELTRHPLSAEYPDLTGKAWDGFVENLKAHGIVGKRKVVLYEGKVIDGWQLHRACVEANLEPTYEQLKLAPGMTAEAYVETVNDHRRHETPDQAMKRAEARRERVAAARQEGKSIRTIAADEGVSKSQVERDLGSTAVTVPGGTVTGQDGRRQPAAKPQADYGDAYEGPVVRDRSGEPNGSPAVNGKDGKTYAPTKPPKNGRETYDWEKFHRGYGLLVNEVEKIAKFYNAIRTPQAEGLRRMIREFKAKFRAFYQDFSGQAAPRE